MRERTTWSRQTIASQLRKVAEDPRAMNQDHLQQQPAADAYEIGGPSEFAEDLSPSGPGWKADYGSDGNTKRDELGLPEMRGDTFNKSDEAPGVSPSRQASVQQIHAKAEVATKVARLMLSKTASETAVENQALVLMDLPLANLQNTLQRLAQDQEQDDDDGDDDGQQKQAADDDGDDDDGEQQQQQKQAGELPKEFLENIKKKKDEAKKDDGDKGQDKEARARKAQQQDDGDDDAQQNKQARGRKAQQQDDDADQGQDKQARARKAQQQDDDGDDEQQQGKQARARKAQQQDDGDDQGQDKKARSVKGQQQQDDGDDGQQKQAQQDQSEDEKQVGKEAYTLIKTAAKDLLALPVSARNSVFKAMLPSLAKVAAYGMEQQGQQQQIGQDQIMAQVQQMVQQAMQQQQQAQQQAPAAPQQQLADQQLVDQMLQEGPALAEDQIQLDAPDMDLGLADEDPALQAIFASDPEVQRALEAQQVTSGHQPTATRTASTRTVGTRPSAGVSTLGGLTSGATTHTEEISKLSGMWASAPDVSNVFRS